MPLTKKCRKEVEAVLKKLIRECDPGEFDNQDIVFKRIWTKGRLVMACYGGKHDKELNELASFLGGRPGSWRQIGFNMSHVMDEKEKMFGSPVLEYR